MVSYKCMANETYKICNDIKKPFHYKQMYEQITGEKPKPNSSTDHCENFRNFIHYNDKRFCHLKDGYFTLQHWVVNNNLLQKYDNYEHKYNLNIYSNALIEAGNRLPYMLNKHNDDPKTRTEKVLKGLKTQICVRNYFESIYKDNVTKPDNDYQTPDKYDFKIFDLRIDVKSVGFYNDKKVLWVEKNRINKLMADVFLCAESNGNVKLLGYIVLSKNKYHYYEKKKYFVFPVESLHDCNYLMIYLNHLECGFKIRNIIHNGCIL